MPTPSTPPAAEAFPASARRWITPFQGSHPAWPVYGALAFVMPWISFLSTKALGVVVPVATLLALGAFWVRKKPLPLKTRIWWLAGGFLLLAALSTIWAPDTAFAWEKTGKLMFFIPLGILLFLLAGDAPGAHRAFALGYGLALGLFVFHVFSDKGLYALLNPSATPLQWKVAMNTPGVVLSLMAGFIISVMTRLGQPFWGWAAFILTAITAAFSENQASAVALGVWLLVFIAARFRPLLTVHLVGYGTALAAIMMPFLFITAHTGGLFEGLDWKAASAGARLEIWSVVSHKVLENPLLGQGLGATRNITDWPLPFVFLSGPTIHHPHNISLQIWLELGAAGILFALIALLVTHRIIAKASPETLPGNIATLAAILLVMHVSFGAWQSWWICALAGLATLGRLLAPPPGPHKEGT